ncbi:MAG: hypothetical protein ACI4S3_07295 [Candidatus Gastranaerophilaceae bacterium]
MSKIIQFEPFKNAKKWDDEYPKFLGNLEMYFGTQTDTEQMTKRLYYAIRYLQGVVNSFWVFDLLGIKEDTKEFEKGKKYCIEWLEEIIKNLKN